MPLRPDIFTIDLLGMRLLSVSFRVSISPLTVGAYCIRPDVGEKGNDGSEQSIVFP